MPDLSLMWSIIRLWAYRVNGERVGLRVRFRSLEQSCLWWGEEPYRERNVQNGRIPRTDCASETVCGILPSDQKRSNFLTSCVKLVQVKRENFIKEPAKRGCVYLGAFLSRFP